MKPLIEDNAGPELPGGNAEDGEHSPVNGLRPISGDETSAESFARAERATG